MDMPQVIHPVRRNLMRTHVSDLIKQGTAETSPYTRCVGADDNQAPVQDRARQFSLGGNTITGYRSRLAECRHVEIAYEDVSSGPQEEMAKVLAFLGLAPEPLRTSLKPSNPQPLSTVLTNFSEVRDKLSNTEFAWMCSG